jgi:hypothetical protein
MKSHNLKSVDDEKSVGSNYSSHRSVNSLSSYSSMSSSTSLISENNNVQWLTKRPLLKSFMQHVVMLLEILPFQEFDAYIRELQATVEDTLGTVKYKRAVAAAHIHWQRLQTTKEAFQIPVHQVFALTLQTTSYPLSTTIASGLPSTAVPGTIRSKTNYMQSKSSHSLSQLVSNTQTMHQSMSTSILSPPDSPSSDTSPSYSPLRISGSLTLRSNNNNNNNNNNSHSSASFTASALQSSATTLHPRYFWEDPLLRRDDLALASLVRDWAGHHPTHLNQHVSSAVQQEAKCERLIDAYFALRSRIAHQHVSNLLFDPMTTRSSATTTNNNNNNNNHNSSNYLHHNHNHLLSPTHSHRQSHNHQPASTLSDPEKVVGFFDLFAVNFFHSDSFLQHKHNLPTYGSLIDPVTHAHLLHSTSSTSHHISSATELLQQKKPRVSRHPPVPRFTNNSYNNNNNNAKSLHSQDHVTKRPVHDDDQISTTTGTIITSSSNNSNNNNRDHISAPHPIPLNIGSNNNPHTNTKSNHQHQMIKQRTASYLLQDPY